MEILYLFISLLFIWSVGNLVFWYKKRTRDTSIRRYAIEMSGLWNAVNLVIAIIGFIALNGQRASTELIDTQKTILALNVFADIIYVLIGLLLTRNKPSNRRKGYAIGLVLQGGFLLVFDAVFLSVLVLSF